MNLVSRREPGRDKTGTVYGSTPDETIVRQIRLKTG
jgi:hypothetical protein